MPTIAGHNKYGGRIITYHDNGCISRALSEYIRCSGDRASGVVQSSDDASTIWRDVWRSRQIAAFSAKRRATDNRRASMRRSRRASRKRAMLLLTAALIRQLTRRNARMSSATLSRLERERKSSKNGSKSRERHDHAVAVARSLRTEVSERCEVRDKNRAVAPRESNESKKARDYVAERASKHY